MGFDNEQLFEEKVCIQCNIQFQITDKDLAFYTKISPQFEGRRYSVPTPKFCPDCRQQRRLSWRNERKLYKRKCDATGKSIISIYSPDKNQKVYEQDFWWGDSWDALDYGKEFDFGATFFEQYEELLKNVPVQSLHNKLVENSPYVNECVSCIDSHLVFNSIHSQKSAYSYILRDGENCYDTGYCDKCFDSYELNECGGNSHSLFFSFKSSKCQESYFLYNCINCKNCIACSNLVDKQYYIFNKEYSPKEYEIEKERLFSKGYDFISEKYKELVGKSFRRHMIGYKNEEVFGDNIFFSKNSHYCYDSNHIEDSKYIYTAMEVDNSYDIYLFGKSLHSSYDSVSVGEKSSHLLFCLNCSVGCYNLLYCQNMTSSRDCFGCVGLRNKKYCILNKQYTKKEYDKLVSQIIKKMQEDGEWGEFFPASLSPFGYNETVAMEYFPLTKEEVTGQTHRSAAPTENNVGVNLCVHPERFNWSDYEPPKPNVEKVIPANKLPQNISDIPDDILNRAIECEVTGKPFRIIPQELEFYRKHNLPIPKRHPDQRHLDRMKLRNPRKLFDRNCDKCGVEMKTTYSPEREEVVYCEECYNKEVY